MLGGTHWALNLDVAELSPGFCCRPSRPLQKPKPVIANDVKQSTFACPS